MLTRGAIANTAAARSLDPRYRNRKGNKKIKGKYIAIAVARFVKIAVGVKTGGSRVGGPELCV